MGDRVAVLSDGRLQQVDTPQKLYDRAGQPVRRHVHRLAGDEPARRAVLLTPTPAPTAAAGRRLVRSGSQSLTVPASLLAARPALRAYDGGRSWSASGPSRCGTPPRGRRRAGRAADGFPAVGHRRAAGGAGRRAAGPPAHRRPPGGHRRHPPGGGRRRRGRPSSSWSARRRRAPRWSWPGSTAAAVARIGDAVEVGVAVDELHFFDPETGHRIADEASAPAPPASPRRPPTRSPTQPRSCEFGPPRGRRFTRESVRTTPGRRGRWAGRRRGVRPRRRRRRPPRSGAGVP